MSTRRYMVRINNKEIEEEQNIIVGDVVATACYYGVVIGFTSKENAQYKVAVQNGDIEDWVNPLKIKDFRFELYTIGDIVNAIGEINKTEFVEVYEGELENGN